MRYFLVGFAMVFATYAWADEVELNESVAAISFNPSRMGTYSHLKIAQEATFLGGLDACTLKNGACTSTAKVNINAPYTVTIEGGSQGEIKTVEPASDATTTATTTKLKTNQFTQVYKSLTQNTSVTWPDGTIETNSEWPGNNMTGVNINMYGGKLGTEGQNSQVFVNKLDSTQAVQIALKKPDNEDFKLITENQTVNFEKNKPFTLGGVEVKVENASPTFTWQTVSGAPSGCAVLKRVTAP